MIRAEQWNQFLKLVASGASISDAASHSGIRRESVYKRKERDAKFAAELEKETLAPKLRAIATIQKAMFQHWQAACWWLERKYQDEFSLKQKVEHSGGLKLNLSELIEKAEKERGL